MCVVFLALPIVAFSNPEKDFNKAREDFLAGEYPKVIPMLTGLLYPTKKLAGANNLAEAHLLLGISYYETKQPEPAKAEIQEALFIEPNLTLEELSLIHI